MSKKIFEVAFQLGAELTSSFRGALKEANNSFKDLQAAGDAMQSVGKSLSAKVTAPIVGMATAAVMVGANFEAGMSKVAATSGAAGTQLEALTAKAREVGAQTQFSATEASDALNYMAMAGWDTEQMLGGIDGVMSLAAASGEDLALTADILTDGLTAFGMKAGESGKFADILAAASSSANTNVAMLGDSFKYVAPLAGAMGYSAEDTSKALSLMANAGIKGSQSGTALKTMMANLASPTKKMKKEMDKLGLSLTDSKGNMKTFDEVMLDMRGSFSELNEIQQASAASTIFGKEAMAGALSIINASEEDFNKLGEAINNSEGAAEEMAAVVNDNLLGRVKEMQSALEEAGISIYQNLQPALEAGVAAVSNLAGWFNNLSPEAKKTVIVIAGVAAAVGPVLFAFGTMTKSMVSVMRTFKVLKIFLAANPFILVIGAIIALGAAFVALYKHSETFRSAVDPLLGVLKTGFVAGFEQVKAVVMDAIPKAIAIVSELIPLITNIAMTVLPMLINVVQQVFPMIVSVISTIIPVIVQIISAVIPIVLLLARTVIPLILNVVQQVFPMVLSIIQGVLPIVSKLIQMVVTVVLTLVEHVLPLLVTVVEAVFPIVLGIIQLVIPLVMGLLTGLVAIIQYVLLPAINGIMTVVQVVFSFVQLYIQNTLDIVNGVIQTAMALLRGDWDGAWEAIKTTATSIMDNILGFFGSINLYDVGKAIIDGLINGIKSMGSSVLGAITNMVPAPIRGVVSGLIGKIPGYAEGGIITSPELAWVGEGGDTESVIPWNNSSRSKDLWMQTGQALGMLNQDGVISNLQQQVNLQTDGPGASAIQPQHVTTSNNSGGAVIHLQYAPQYSVASPDDLEQVKQHSERDKEDLLTQLAEIQRNEKRLAF